MGGKAALSSVCSAGRAGEEAADACARALPALPLIEESVCC